MGMKRGGKMEMGRESEGKRAEFEFEFFFLFTELTLM